MGCLYGGKLSAVPENDVILLDVWKEHIEEIKKNGLLMEEDGIFQTYSRIKAETDAREAGICDLAVIFVKSTMTRQAVESNLAVFGGNTIALTLQNGLGNIDLISEVIKPENVIAGTTAHGATMLGPGKIRHAGTGKTVIGELGGEKTGRVVKIQNMLAAAGLEAETTDNVIGLVWDKLIVNAGINALTSITKLLNGELLDHPEILTIMEGAIAECVSVAKVKGIKIPSPDPFQHTKDVCAATAKNKSSMLQDILNRKRTEIDMINGAIVREGLSAGVETPINRVLTNLIKFTEKRY